MNIAMVTLGLISFGFAGLLSADPITYNIAVNTTTVSGTNGSLDFNFNPGPLLSQTASLQILNFSSDGLVTGSPTKIGNVTGSLPTTLNFDNGAAFNDYFQEFTFGSTLSFDINLFGPALSSPDGISTSGSTFAFSIFSNGAGTIPTLTTSTSTGIAFTLDVNLDGTTSASNFSPQTTVGSGASSVPEPESAELLGAGLLCVGGLFLQRYKRAFMN